MSAFRQENKKEALQLQIFTKCKSWDKESLTMMSIQLMIYQRSRTVIFLNMGINYFYFRYKDENASQK